MSRLASHRRRESVRIVSDKHLKALRDAEPEPYWIDEASDVPEAAETLVGQVTCDLAVVGGGYFGLWAALVAKERDPSLDVVLLEGKTVGWAASGRNGGFCAASLTHGLQNGLTRWPQEMGRLEQLGLQNLQAIIDTLQRYGIDAELERTGELSVASEQWQLEELAGAVRSMQDHGHDVQWYDRDELRASINSPTYLGGLWDRNGAVLVNPAELAWGLKRACEQLGVRFFEHSSATAMESERQGVTVRTPYGAVRARTVALATNAFPPLLKRLRHYFVPVYDYALMTQPLTPQQLASVGWADRQGVGDSANQFHYYRLTRDNRILWGGYDAIYYYAGSRGGRGSSRQQLDQRPETFITLTEHFFQTFPQLEDVAFSNIWGGAIDTSSRFCQFWGTALDKQVAYVVGYTGLGVGASRFGAEVMLDLLSGRRTELTELNFVKSKPLPFPPEPLRYGAIQLTRWSIDRADQHGGRRNAWLRTLDRLGLGFDS